MAFNQPQQFIPQSPKQIKKEYMETPFWLSLFGPGRQFTIVEDHPMSKPFRYQMKPSNKGGPAYAENLIRITDGYLEKDLSFSMGNAKLLMRCIPDNITNLKGVTLANNNGNWEFVSQTDESMNYGFKPAISQNQPITDQTDMFVGKMIEAIKGANLAGVQIDVSKLTKIADGISPGNALEMIASAKSSGLIYEKDGIFVVVN